MIDVKLSFQKKNFNQFKKELDYVYNNNKIYREKMISSNIKLSDIKDINDIAKLPLTCKSDFFVDYPYGFYSTGINNVLRYHASSGTTGKSVIVGFTENDLKLRNNMIVDICKMAGIKKSDVVQICYGYGMFTGGLGFHEALQDYGCTIVPTSAGNTEKQILYMRQLHTTVLITSPSYAMHIYEVAKDIDIDVKNLDVRMIKVGSELLTEGMRKKLKDAWGSDVVISQDYGMTETMGPGLGCECSCHDGLHLYDKNFIYELVDPITKKPTDKNIGELVITTLYNECFPLIRYATNDIVELEFSKCQCGNNSARIKRIVGRSDDMMKIKGVKIYLSQIEDFILSHSFCTPNYIIVLTKEDFIDDIKIDIEYYQDLNLENKWTIKKLEKKQELLMEQFKSVFGIKADIELLMPNTIPRCTGKVKRIKDLRGN